MLRASSLGLSLPSPTIFALRQCRRLHGVRSRLGLAQNGLKRTSTSSIVFQSTLSNPGPEETNATSRDVAATTVSQAVEQSAVVSVGSVGLEETREEPASTSHAPTAVGGPDAEAEAQMRAQFLALMSEELDIVGITLETLHTQNWTPPVAGQTQKSLIPIKPVEISSSLHPPLTLLINQLRKGYQTPESLESTLEDLLSSVVSSTGLLTSSPMHDSDAEERTEEPNEYLSHPLPPRDIVAQIWKYLHILGTTPSSDDAWDAYVFLLDVVSEYPLVHAHIPHIPFSHLHRFCRVLARARPKTHRQYLRLLSVMTYIVHCGGRIHQHEMNALIDMSAKGRRKTELGMLEKQLSVFTDVRAGQLPGASIYTPNTWQPALSVAFEPDVMTMTSLITSAARAGSTMTLREIVMLMQKTGLTPNRISHIAMLAYYVKREDLSGLRATLQRMRQLDYNLGVEGLNACMHAYSKFNKITVVFMIYRLLRNNIVREEYRGEGDIYHAAAELAEEFIFVEPEDLPDKVTYTLVVQVMAYHGQFRAAMEVFLDMLSRAEEKDVSADSSSKSASNKPASASEIQPEDFHPTFAVYRGIFIGFCRHGIHPYEAARRQATDWTLANLKDIFNRFLTLPADLHLTNAELWIVMYAFAKASDWDLNEMRKAWVAIDKRFGIDILRPDGHSAIANLKRRLFFS